MGAPKNRPKDEEHRLSLPMPDILIYEAMAILSDSLLHFGNPVSLSFQVDQKQHELIDAYSSLGSCARFHVPYCSVLLYVKIYHNPWSFHAGQTT